MNLSERPRDDLCRARIVSHRRVGSHEQGHEYRKIG
jgi:hypothetical protein